MDAITDPLGKLRQELAQILEVERVERDQKLLEFETWDSLAALSIVAAVHGDFHVILRSEELAGAKTIGNLEDLVLSKLPR
ncbi:MAG: phosphopantetheine-binding protein [Bryobacteraceae bacterium]|jgi:acyl carrier protein